MSLDPDSFRSVLGRFASGVTIVTARDADGRDQGMTVSAFASLSLEPPLVLVCVDRQATMHAVLETATHFAVNILAAPQEALSRRFSSPDPQRRFEGIGYTRGQTACPLLDDTLAWLECRNVRRHDGGDHSIFVGEVQAAMARPETPLLYYRGGYAQVER